MTGGILALLLTFIPGLAAGQVIDKPGSLDIIEQSTYVAADGVLDLHLAVGLPTGASPDDYQLAVVVHGRLNDEDEVDQPDSDPLNRLPSMDLNDLPRPHGQGVATHGLDSTHRVLSLPVRSGPQFDDQNRILLPDEGVYPVAVELRGPDGPIASVRTHLVRLPTVTSEDGQHLPALPVSIILPVSTAEGLTVDDAIGLLSRHATIPLTVVLGEGVQNQLLADDERTAALVSALAGRPVLSVPTIDLDPSALAEIDHADLFVESALLARSETRALGFTVPDDVALQSSPLTAGGAAVLNGMGIDTVLDLTTGTGTGSVRRAIDPTGGRIRVEATDSSATSRLSVAVVDRQLSRTLGGGDGGPQRANRLLAKLTLRALTGDGGPVVLGGAALGPDPGPSLDAFFRALAQPGAPRPTLLNQATGALTIRPSERPEQDLRPVWSLLTKARVRLATYDDFHRRGGTDPAHHRSRLVAGLDRQRNPDDRRRALESVVAGLDEDLTVIDLPDGQPVTLAAQSAPIPIAVHNTAEGPRQVLLRFKSDKVSPVDGERLVTIPPGTSAIDVAVEARSLGISPLEVTAWTPDGRTLLAGNRLEIRSTAVPGLGLLLTVAAVGLLIAWWIVDSRQKTAKGTDSRPAVA